MNKIERTITIHRPVEEVFAYVCDVEHGPRYTSGQREAHRTSSGPMGIGSTFATSGKFLRRGATFEITEYELNRRLAWKATSGARAMTTVGLSAVRSQHSRQIRPSGRPTWSVPVRPVSLAGARGPTCRSGPR